MAVRFVVRSRDGQKLQTELDFPFDQARIVIGRGTSADVRIPHPTVSEAHAGVQLRGTDWMIGDLGSRNGTRVNGQRLHTDRHRKLRDGDLIELGTYVLSFHAGVVMTEPMSAERTAELARRLWREAQHAQGIELPAARLCVLDGSKAGETLTIAAAPSRALIGSGQQCQLVLDEPALARDTLELVHDHEGVLLRSLNNEPLLVLGEARLRSRRLRDGDEIGVGSTRLRYEEPAQTAIDALKGEPDAPLPSPEPARVAQPPQAEPERQRPTATAPDARQASKPHSGADLIVYALAIAVLVASALGLAMLLRVH